MPPARPTTSCDSSAAETSDTIIGEYYGSQHRNPITLRELLRYFRAICQVLVAYYAHSPWCHPPRPQTLQHHDRRLWRNPPSSTGASPSDIKNKTDPCPLLRHRQLHTTTRKATIARRINREWNSPASPILNSPWKARSSAPPPTWLPNRPKAALQLHTAPSPTSTPLGGILYKILCGQSPQAPNASTAGSKTGQAAD